LLSLSVLGFGPCAVKSSYHRCQTCFASATPAAMGNNMCKGTRLHPDVGMHATHTRTLKTKTRWRGKDELAVASSDKVRTEAYMARIAPGCTDACFVRWLTGRSNTERMCWACCVASHNAVDCSKQQTLLDYKDRRCKSGTCNGLKVGLRDSIVGTVSLHFLVCIRCFPTSLLPS
jgi:hypothetical protein